MSTAGNMKKRENKFPFCFLSLSARTRSVWSGGGLECEHNCQQIAFDSNVSWRLLLLLPYRLKNRIPTPKWQSVGGSFWDSFYRLLFGVPPQSLSLSPGKEKKYHVICQCSSQRFLTVCILHCCIIYYTEAVQALMYVTGIINNISDATHFVYYNIYSRYYLVCPFLDRHIHIFRFTWTLFFFYLIL